MFCVGKKTGYFVAIVLSMSLASCVTCSDNKKGGSRTRITSVIEPPVGITTFRNPILNSGADPWVLKDGNEYFVTYTTGNNITLLRTNKMSDIRKALPKTVWVRPATGLNSRDLWAPELHKINGKWYVYYAASDGKNENHRMWVLENASTDPFTGTWIDKGELYLPDNKWAIDGSPFEINGRYYFIWSGWEGDVNLRQAIYIAEMDTPYSVIGNRKAIVIPTNSWETNTTNPQVTEGPQFLLKNGKAFIFYSAGACWTDGYSIGAIWMDSTSNPMELASWQRMVNNPLFASNSADAFGPGHNSFFKSLDDSQDWILYHANPQSGQGCGANRSMRMQQISWNTNGFPVLGVPESLNKDIKIPHGE